MLVIEGLHLHRSKQIILDNINLRLERAQIYGLLGSNGAGKTSLIKQICGIFPVQQGRIYVDGYEVTSMPPRKRSKLVAYTPQLHTLSFGYSVYEMVAMGCHPYGVEQPIHIEKVLRETDLWKKKNSSILELSGGEQQRVFLTRALVQHTPFLVMDEPFTFLDPRQQHNMIKVLKHYKDSGHTLLVSMHDLELAKKLCDQLIFLKDGKLFQTGKTSQLIREDLIERLYE